VTFATRALPLRERTAPRARRRTIQSVTGLAAGTADKSVVKAKNGADYGPESSKSASFTPPR
jgi:hypothetical protein